MLLCATGHNMSVLGSQVDVDMDESGKPLHQINSYVVFSQNKTFVSMWHLQIRLYLYVSKH